MVSTTQQLTVFQPSARQPAVTEGPIVDVYDTATPPPSSSQGIVAELGVRRSGEGRTRSIERVFHPAITGWGLSSQKEKTT